MRQWNQIVAILAVGSIAFVFTGCGSGSSTSMNDGGSNTIPFVTRSSSGNFSQDALILAARESTDAWIRTDVATERDAELKTIREKFPVTADLHARPDGEMRDTLVSVFKDASWHGDWESGTLTTGNPTLDALLTEYKLAAVSKVLSVNDSTVFKLTFEHPLNIRHIAARIKDTSDRIKYAEVNGLVGDGNNIAFRLENGQKKYDFSRGWGDCPSGCINRRHWVVTVAADGSMTIEESGTALPD
jgi:hypothetical protein